MIMIDRAPVTGARRTADGYLVAEVRVARTGIQVYSGAEVGRPELADVRVYRPEDEVFARDAMASFAHRPVTNDHPDTAVDASNWRDVAVGIIGGDVIRDGDHVRVPLVLMDADAIRSVEEGKRELSAGYDCNIDWTPGTTDAGASYDAVQRTIRINHVAVVDRGRAGSSCKIGDKDTAMKTITVDGYPVETTDAAATVIDKLVKERDEARAAKDAADAARDVATAARDAAERKLADADATIEDRIAERAAVVADAEKVAGKAIDAKGKSVSAIKREAVVSRLGDKAKDASDAYVAAAFDLALADAATTTDPVADALKRAKPVATTRDAAHAAYVAHLNAAWKGGDVAN
jgi:hypothetical protein